MVEPETPPHTFEWMTKDDAHFLFVGYRADPKKRSEEWKIAASRGMDEDRWRVEYEGDEYASLSRRVFTSYNDRLHAPVEYRTKPFPVIPASIWFGGWDAGQTLHPAFCLLQLEPKSFQCLGMMEVLGDEAEDASLFIPRVLRELADVYPQVLEIHHFADPTITTRSGTDGRSAMDIFGDYGVHVRQSTNKWLIRRNAVSWILTDMISQDDDLWTPRFALCGKQMPGLRKALSGGYKYPDNQKGVAPENRAIRSMPLKNEASHIADAFQYACIAVKDIVTEGQGRSTVTYTRTDIEYDEPEPSVLRTFDNAR